MATRTLDNSAASLTVGGAYSAPKDTGPKVPSPGMPAATADAGSLAPHAAGGTMTRPPSIPSHDYTDPQRPAAAPAPAPAAPVVGQTGPAYGGLYGAVPNAGAPGALGGPLTPAAWQSVVGGGATTPTAQAPSGAPAPSSNPMTRPNGALSLPGSHLARLDAGAAMLGQVAPGIFGEVRTALQGVGQEIRAAFGRAHATPIPGGPVAGTPRPHRPTGSFPPKPPGSTPPVSPNPKIPRGTRGPKTPSA